ncbi:TraQ conjugal transfer family protein [Arenibacter latericius]|uniref:TraQ conjugal transfer family protein n=1 Tax=Arenibacter latericius TaxID=86104 RepID=UPI00040C26F8|nr:TraQ conjugal transfer family protein [Arenibacter latericius]
MKKIDSNTHISIGLLLALLILIFSCSKDFESLVLDSFDFSFTGEHPTETYLFENTRTSFTLTPEKEISTIAYFIKYLPSNKKGYFTTLEGDTIRPHDTLQVKTRQWNYNYVAIDTGTHQVRFMAWDTNANKKELSLAYRAHYASFSFLLNKGVNEFIINSKNPINATLLRDKETLDPNNKNDFEITYQIQNGTGKLYIDDQAFDAGTPFFLPKGITELRYLPETLGEHKLSLTATAPDGATKTEELLFTVVNLDFTINTTAASTVVELDTNLAIAVDLNTQDEESKVNYEITHSFSATSEGAGTVRDQNGGVMEPGQYRAIIPGSYNYTFTSKELGNRMIYFSVRDSNAQTKRDSVAIEVANIPFSFTGNSGSNSVFINERTQLNFNLKSNGNTEIIQYSLSHQLLEGNGRVEKGDGTLLQNSKEYEVEIGDFSLFYYPESLGSHQIAFMVTDNYGQEVGPVVIDLETKQNDFTLTITPSKTSEFVNTPINTIIDVDEIPEGTNDMYEAFYSSGKNSSLQVNGTTYEPGEKFQLGPNNNNVVYIGAEPGQHNLVISVESGANVTHTASTVIDYKQIDFLFTAGSQKSDISVGETTSLNFNISENVGTSNYKMRYSLNGNALIKDENGIQVSAGNIYEVPKGNFNWSLEGTDESNVELVFYVQNDTGLEKSAAITVAVTPKDYNFSANATQSKTYTETPVPVNFNISEIGIGGDSYTMYFSSGNNNGTFEYNGNTYSAGESFSVPTGSFQGMYTGLTEDTHQVAFTVRSSSQVEKTANVSIEIEKYEEFFDLTVSQSTQDKFEDQPFLINVVTNAPAGHDSEVTYEMTFQFSGMNGGYINHRGIIYKEGEVIPLEYGSVAMQFYPEIDDSFTINFRVENSTGISQTTSESIEMLKKPTVAVKGEKHNISCGGLNGCDYVIRIYTCFAANCSEAYNGATLQQVEVRVYNRKDKRWDTMLFNYNDAKGSGVERYFELEEEPKESKLRYLDQDYEIRVQDSNGQWSDVIRGTIVRV